MPGAAITTAGSLADGIVAQSVGGGGGNGGSAASSNSATTYAASISLGGNAAQGGAANNVSVTNSNSITTLGDQSIGLFAQSVGGGGGKGGSSSSSASTAVSATNAPFSLSLSLGGVGGAGGTTGTVTVTNSGNIATSGANSTGLFAQSVGGGGGSGGSSVSTAKASINKRVFTAVTLATTGQLPSSTNAPSEAGAAAGYYSATKGGGAGGPGGNALSVSLGGSGGAGQDGNSVTVTNSAAITTGAGSSCTISTCTLTGASLTSGSTSVTVGSTAGLVAGSPVSNSYLPAGTTIASITSATQLELSAGAQATGGNQSLSYTNVAINNNSLALFAQSVGGGGGNGASSQANGDASQSTAALSLGGTGGVGGNGGSVTVTNSGVLATNGGSGSSALFAQSVGGGGGNGGGSTTNTGAGGTAAIAIGLGGNGSGGGNGGNVSVTVTGSNCIGIYNAAGATCGAAAIVGGQTGAQSDGIFAQSVGGGGGNGGSTVISSTAVGGGSGIGGTAAASATGTSASTPSSGDGGAVAIGIGGFGGGGGNGGQVSVTTSAPISVSGEQSVGIFAQSIGGGGGNGGGVLTNANSGANAVALGIGGSGGSGGAGGQVAVTATGIITTTGDLADGILAQSVGGGGGNGGPSSSTSVGLGDVSLSMAIGGSGGTGQSGGTVTVTTGSPTATGAWQNVPNIMTGNSSSTLVGVGSPGVLAQSIGGGGGTGGSNITSTSVGQVVAGIAIGGSGGSGGNGGVVTVYPYGNVFTYGNNSPAILAQSIGGGGGNGLSTTGTGGGGNVTTTVAVGYASSSAGSSPSSIGGTGGSVTVLSANAPPGSGGSTGAAFGAAQRTRTYGVNSFGILVQSIGAGGGVGSVVNTNSGATSSSSTILTTTSADIALGGGGYAGGAGGTVSATLGSGPGPTSSAANINWILTGTSTTPTNSSGAIGLVAQSIGGGGGVGASNDSLSGQVQYQSSLALGGSGGSNYTGGSGGTTTITNGAFITTYGPASSGMVVQSIGGGGGIGQSTVAIPNSNDTVSASLALGSNGGSGQNGSVVNVTNSGQIVTSGAASSGLIAQSIGDGGGLGVLALSGSGAPSTGLGTTAILGGTGGSGAGGSASVASTGVISTTAVQSSAIVVQSIGGGGGLSAIAPSASSGTVGGTNTLQLGQAAGSGGNGGAVSVTIGSANISPSVTTTANYSAGVIAQSIGGGGGLSTSPLTGPILLGSVSAGAGGNVIATNYATISTTGAASPGMLLQSVGGGGGIAMSAGSGRLQLGNGNAAGSLSAASGGNISVSAGGSITTSGINSPGILAQSVGGGGGIVLTAGSASTSTARAGNGNGGNVTVTINGSVTTSGAGSNGVMAVSIGGGGGLVQNGTNFAVLSGSSSAAAGTGGAVNVYVNGKVKATGTGSNGLYTYSNTDPQVTIAPGASVSGGIGGAGVVLNGPTNTLTNNGTVLSQEGANGLAVQSIGGGTRIDNARAIAGSVQLSSLAGGANNLLNNLPGGTLTVGNSIDLGGKLGVLNNQGTLALGNGVGITTINGSLSQGSSGTLLVRVASSGGALDQYQISGNATIGGTIQPIRVNTGLLPPGSVATTILTAAGGITYAGLLQPSGSAIQTYALSLGTNGDLQLVSTVNYSPSGLSGYSSQIGQAIGLAETNGPSLFLQQVAGALLNAPNTQVLADDYRAIGAEGATSVPQVTFEATQMAIDIVTDRMDVWRTSGLDGQRQHSGSDTQMAAGGDHKPVRVWIAMLGEAVGNQGLNGSTFGGVIGLDGEAGQRSILLGAALNLSQSRFGVSDPGSSINATNFGASVYSVAMLGDAYLSGIGYVGGNGAGFASNLYSLGLNLQASTRFNGVVTAGRFEAGQSFDLGDTGARITPYAAIQPMQIWQGGATENFGFGGGIRFANANIPSLPMNLGIQLSGSWTPMGGEEGETLEPFLRLAWMHDFLPNRQISRSFIELPGASFTSSGGWNVSDAALVRAGIHYQVSKSVSLFGSVESQLSSNYRSIGGTAGIRYQW